MVTSEKPHIIEWCRCIGIGHGVTLTSSPAEITADTTAVRVTYNIIFEYFEAGGRANFVFERGSRPEEGEGYATQQAIKTQAPFTRPLYLRVTPRVVLLHEKK